MTRKRTIAQSVIRVAVLGLCGWKAFDGRYPPAQAQSPRTVYVQPVVTAEDVGQDHDIAAINEHLKNTDATVQRQWASVQNNTNEIAGLRGEERIFSAVIGLLSGGGLLLNFSRRKV